ncbi:hypothetical protein [Bradyrhizobium sp. Bra64]|uniref:hypothetical protein n=1 Tax=Bradyrhizobium sp. Bra64 TaxID=2926009 RepID=UPI00356AF0B5
MDAPANVVYLPRSRLLAAEMGLSPHPGGHLESYNAACNELDAIAEISDPVLRSKAIEDLQDAMRIALANGDLFTNKPSTSADVTSVNQSFLAHRGKYLADHTEEQKRIRELRQTGSHLIKFSPYLGNFDREKQLSKAMANNPGLNLTAGSRDLEGTPWSEFAGLGPSSSIFRIPGSTPANPSDFPPLPGYSSPSLAGLNEQERFSRIDPRLTGVLPAFPALRPNEQRLGQLPPTTAALPEPQVLQFHSETGQPLTRLSDGSPVLGPQEPPDRGSALLMGAGVLAAGAMMVPGTQGLGAALLAGLTAAALTRPAFSTTAPHDTKVADGSVFSDGAAPYKAFDVNVPSLGSVNGWDDSAGPSELSQTERRILGPETGRAGRFVDRFGNLTDTPAGTMPAQNSPEPLLPSAAGAVAPEEVRRLTRVNESNAGSAFTSGSAPVPYLPSAEFNDRFGNWTMPTADGRQPEPSRPIGPFANEPSYLIPPPIFGVDGAGSPHNDAEEWFSRWIRPLLRQE